MGKWGGLVVIKVVGAIVGILGVALIICFGDGVAQNNINKIENYSYIQDVKRLCSQQKYTDARSLLDLIIDENYWEAKQAAEWKVVICEKIQASNTISSRAERFADGALGGKINSKEACVGATVANLFVIGDVIDLLKECCSENPDKGTCFLSVLGIVTTGQPIDRVISCLKCVNKIKGVSKGIRKVLHTIITKLEKNKSNVDIILDLMDSLASLSELYSNVENSVFVLCLKGCQNLDDVECMLKLVSNVETREKVLRVLLVAKLNDQIGIRTVEYLVENDKKGVEDLYKVLSKGPEGIDVVINTNKQSAIEYPLRMQIDYFRKFVGLKKDVQILGLGLLFLVVSGVCIVSKRNRAKASISLSVVGGVVLLVYLLCESRAFTKPSGQIVFWAGLAKEKSEGSSLISYILVVFFIVLQSYIFFLGRKNIEKIKNSNHTTETKLQLMESSSLMLDLPVYMGLLGTILSFSLILYFPDWGKILGYISTVVGMLYSVALRLKYEIPFKKKLIIEVSEKEIRS